MATLPGEESSSKKCPVQITLGRTTLGLLWLSRQRETSLGFIFESSLHILFQGMNERFP
jgi:hypothetical protein